MPGLGQFSAHIFPTDLKTGTSGSLKLNIFIARWMGVPLLGLKNESQCFQMVMLGYGIPTMIVITYIYTIFELYDLWLSWPDLDKMTQNSCLSLTHLAGCYKITNAALQFPNIAKVIEKFELLTRKYAVTNKQREAYLHGEWQNKMFYMLYASVVGATGIFGAILLYYSPEKVGGQIFPYRVYLPQLLPNHLRLLYMAVAVFVLALQVVSIDYLNVSLMNQLRFHLNILNLAFEELIIADNDDYEDDVQVHDGRKRKEKIKCIADPNKRLRRIIEHHIYLKSLRNEIENLFRMPVLTQFVTAVLVFALTGFQATVSKSNINGAILIYFYCVCIFCQLFFYCWFGNEVSEQNKTLADSGFTSTWYKFDARYKKSLLIFITNAQRPILFTAGGFMSLSLPSFSGILSRAYTYIAVLRQLNGK